MNIWKVMAHHENPKMMAEWCMDHGKLAVGWGQIGDLRELMPSEGSEIKAQIKEHYPELRNSSQGGSSLWNFFERMAIGDRVLLSGGRRFFVAEVIGDYCWASPVDAIGDYQHQRLIAITDENPEELWKELGGKIAKGQNPFLTVALCISTEQSATEVYSEGTRFETLATAFERNPKARKACLAHHGFRCKVCDLDFGERYGSLGEGFIHVHHLNPLGEVREARKVDPVKDLVPLCPNCHAMIHRRRPALTVEELQRYLKA